MFDNEPMRKASLGEGSISHSALAVSLDQAIPYMKKQEKDTLDIKNLLHSGTANYICTIKIKIIIVIIIIIIVIIKMII